MGKYNKDSVIVERIIEYCEEIERYCIDKGSWQPGG